MIPSHRRQYNEQFTPERYAQFLSELQSLYSGGPDFRVAETPLFIPKDFVQKMLGACDAIINVTSTPEYYQQSERAIPSHLRVPNEDAQPQFIAFDFGICTNSKGEVEPQLIEMQGFPSLFCWQVVLPEVHQKHFHWPQGFEVYLNGYNRESYIELLHRVIIGDAKPENVILLEILPHEQKTRVDFYATKDLLGIEVVCLTELILEGKELYYLRNGEKTKVERIFNRVIFDDLHQQAPEVQEKGKIFQQELDVTWVPHPNWFYRLSKFTLPFIDHPYVPKTYFLHEFQPPAAELHQYVVKPLFSFAGQGVIIDVTPQDIEAIRDPQNWIIQKKVEYAAAIVTPDENAKGEIRLFYFLEGGKGKPVAANNLARLSKGKMVGVRYNKDKEWVGGSFCLFEQ